MQLTRQKGTDTEAKLSISGDESELATAKTTVLKRLQRDVSAPGFRKGKAPLNVVEKQVDEGHLNREFLDEAMTQLFQKAIDQERLRVVSRPEVEIKKFVPFNTLEFDVSVAVVPPIKLGDYKKIKKKRPEAKVTDKDVENVIESLRQRAAKKEPVTRAAKKGDEVVIDFSGKGDKGQDVAGAKGTDYPLLIGSDTFIKGFEPELVGLKKGDKKDFTLSFPKDYPHAPLQGKKVTFSVSVKDVNEIALPKVDDAFAAQVSPLKKVAELRDDIKRQLAAEKQREADNKLKDELIEELVKKSTVTAPQGLVDEQIAHLERDFKQNLVYRGMTFEEYLKQADLSEDDFRAKELKEKAERQVQVGLVLSEVAAAEKLTVTPEELEIRLQLLKGQHQDEATRAELDKPEVQRDLASRMLSEKTIDTLVNYASS